MPRSTTLLAATAVACVPLFTATGAFADWMAYAIDGRGKFGHARAASREAAIDAALDFCDRPSCRIIAAVQARCTALASSNHRGYWVGMGSAGSRAGAIGHAIQWCGKNAPESTCRIAHTYCK